MSIQSEMHKVLSEIGLKRPEIKVYLASLDLGSASAIKLAEAVSMNRVTVYEILKRLSRKGFVKIRVKKNVRGRYFVPAEYNEIVERIKERQLSLTDQLNRMATLKGAFQAQFSRPEEKPVVLFYEGVEGIKGVLEDTLQSNIHEVVSFASIESLECGFDKSFLENYWKQRTEKGVKTRGIVPNTKKAAQEFTDDRNQKELRQLRFIDPNLYDFTNEIDIYGDNIGILSLAKGNEYGIIIRSKGVAQSFRSVFETLWKMSGEYDA